MEWETVIGLEIHVQLATKSKLFSGAATKFGALPNTQACTIDLGMPGVLPVLNKEAVSLACKFGTAINAEINNHSVFARKNYFYPDLPKGYQISQFDIPIVGKGSMTIEIEDGVSKTIGITRAHLEEDAGKSLHEDFHGKSGIDLNRAGIPLLEIVTEPDMRSAKEAVAFLKNLHSLVRYLDLSDANMQEGSFRCDANVSIRPKGSDKFGTRAEIKNLNSFKFIEKAIHFEVSRQKQLLENDQVVVQETRLYDSDKNETRSMRGKEEANDYRYFPDPDLLPVNLEKDFLANIKNNMPELPWDRKARFIKEFKLNNEDASILVNNKFLANYFDEVILKTQDYIKNNKVHEKDHTSLYKLATNWILGDLLGALNKNNLEINSSPITAQDLAELVAKIHDNTISGKIAKSVFESLWEKEGNVESIIEKKGLKQITDDGPIIEIINNIIVANPQQVADYRSGKDKLFGFFVGQVMKESKGKANPAKVNQLLKDKLS